MDVHHDEQYMLLIRYSNGKILMGALLAMGDQKIRVAVKGEHDAVEYRLISCRWVSEDCEVVSIGSARPASGEDAPVFDGQICTTLQSTAARLVM